MKKLLTLLLLATLFVSCSSDDDDIPTQDYTSFEIFTNEDIILKESVIGYYTSDGSCKKLVDLGTLTKGVHSKEVIINIDTLKNIYFFSDYPRISTKFDTVFVLKKNINNIFEIKDYTKGIKVDKTDPTQYPQ